MRLGSIVLVRHGETEWSAAGRHTSTTDIGLTAAGLERAVRLRDALAARQFALVLTSPLRRARDTAAAAGFPHAEIAPDLTEWDYGDIEGRTTDEITAEVGHRWNIWDASPPDPVPAEPCGAVGVRTDAVIARATPLVRAGRDVLLFAHGHLLRILSARWLGQAAAFGEQLELGPATLSELGFERDTQVLQSWNLSVPEPPHTT